MPWTACRPVKGVQGGMLYIQAGQFSLQAACVINTAALVAAKAAHSCCTVLLPWDEAPALTQRGPWPRIRQSRPSG